MKERLLVIKEILNPRWSTGRSGRVGEIVTLYCNDKIVVESKPITFVYTIKE